jgi:hypothetical protein
VQSDDIVSFAVQTLIRILASPGEEQREVRPFHLDIYISGSDMIF